uniref:Uncharacterized protein n=1 Tax=Anguilla anguilla TaxID=7936 RepID=A0A0E9RS03_ANGAN
MVRREHWGYSYVFLVMSSTVKLVNQNVICCLFLECFGIDFNAIKRGDLFYGHILQFVICSSCLVMSANLKVYGILLSDRHTIGWRTNEYCS